MKSTLVSAFATTILLTHSLAFADTFGGGASLFNIEFVTIGDPGNIGDQTGGPYFPIGSVPESFRMSTYEISEEMVTKANGDSAGEGNPLGITVGNLGPNKPATSISWVEAAKFVNWLNTDSGFHPAYSFDENGTFQLWELSDPGHSLINPVRNEEAKYFLPTLEEWYKAAYYDPSNEDYYDYPVGADIVFSFAGGPLPPFLPPGSGVAVFDNFSGPADVDAAGSLSPYGTMAQGGNVFEWLETAGDTSPGTSTSTRIIRGGAYFSPSTSDLASVGPHYEYDIETDLGDTLGFRVASVVNILPPNADYDNNGSVDGLDFLKWQRGETLGLGADEELALWQLQYGDTVLPLSTTSAVPEPATSVLALGALCLAMSRRWATY